MVVPLYNYAHTIGEALASIVKQDFQPLSIIVVDDCSRDDGAQTAGLVGPIQESSYRIPL